MRFGYSPFHIARLLALTAVMLALFSLAGEYVLTHADLETESALARAVDLFSVNLESSIPTWFSMLILFISAALLAVIATGKRASRDRFTFHWIGLALIFLYLSMDEGAAIHEIFSDIMEQYIEPTGLVTFGWVLVGAPVALIVALLYLRFVLHLPAHIRNLFFIAGGLYIGGALVVESISASQYVDDGNNFRYLAIATVEELCEMLGVTTLIYALLSYMRQSQVEIALHPTPVQPPVTRGIVWIGAGVALIATIAVSAVIFSENQPVVTEPFYLQVVRAVGDTTEDALLVGETLDYPAEIISRDSAGQFLNMTSQFYHLVLVEPVSQLDIQTVQLFSVPFYQAVERRLKPDGLIITALITPFTPEQRISRQIAASLLMTYDEVMVVTSGDEAVALAADDLPFDRQTLSDRLSESGLAGFILFDTPAVQAVVGDAQPVE